jgi:hypothetical protein
MKKDMKSIRVRLEAPLWKINLENVYFFFVIDHKTAMPTPEEIIFKRLILPQLKSSLDKKVPISVIEKRLKELGIGLYQGWLDYSKRPETLLEMRWLKDSRITKPPWLLLDVQAPRLIRESNIYLASTLMAQRFWTDYCADHGFETMQATETDQTVIEKVKTNLARNANAIDQVLNLPDGLICLEHGYKHVILNGQYQLLSPANTVANQAGMTERLKRLVQKPDAELGIAGHALLEQVKSF